MLKEIKQMAEKWQEILGLKRWQIDFSVLPAEQMNNTLARVKNRDYVYYTAEIEVNESCLLSKLEETICHELLHILVGEISHQFSRLADRITQQEVKLINEAEEGVVDLLERILILAYREPKTEQLALPLRKEV